MRVHITRLGYLLLRNTMNGRRYRSRRLDYELGKRLPDLRNQEQLDAGMMLEWRRRIELKGIRHVVSR